MHDQPVDATNVADHYAPTVCAAARLLAAVGGRLQTGDRIPSGSLTHVRVTPGNRVAAVIEDLGRVEATIAA